MISLTTGSLTKRENKARSARLSRCSLALRQARAAPPVMISASSGAATGTSTPVYAYAARTPATNRMPTPASATGNR